PALLTLGPDLLRADQLLDRQAHRAHVGPQRLGDLLAALAGLLLHIGEDARAQLLDLGRRTLRAPSGTARPRLASAAKAPSLARAPALLPTTAWPDSRTTYQVSQRRLQMFQGGALGELRELAGEVGDERLDLGVRAAESGHGDWSCSEEPSWDID